jgi:hypothetical protein
LASAATNFSNEFVSGDMRLTWAQGFDGAIQAGQAFQGIDFLGCAHLFPNWRFGLHARTISVGFTGVQAHAHA